MKQSYKEIFDKLYQKESQTDHILICDGTNLFISAFIANPLISDNGEHVGGLYGFLLSLGAHIRNFNPTKCIVVFDGAGGSVRRKKVYPEYKANRTNRQRINRIEHFTSVEDEVRSMQFQYVRLYQYLQTLPLSVISIDNIEADDTIAYITKQYYADQEKQMTIISSDRDFYQLVDDKINVYSPQKKILFTPEEIQAKFEFHPNNYLLYRALTGDVSDNIPGINGMGLKTFKKLFDVDSELSLDQFKNILEEKLKEKKVPKVLQTLGGSLDILDRNYRLMQLHNVDISGNSKISIINKLEMDVPNLDRSAFRKLCLEDSLHMNFRNPDDWLLRSFKYLDTYGG